MTSPQNQPFLTPSSPRCKDRPFRALAKVKSTVGVVFGENPFISMKIFKALAAEPILSYAIDFWGILKLPQNNAIENVHLSFCKQLIGVQNQTVNMRVFLEHGKVPLTIFAHKKCNKKLDQNCEQDTMQQCNTMQYNDH